ncbi:hypothetical protein OCU04_010834 [Sclerotinia nivalis]|uniref:Uncharacterized protein n=1 Tax=Sclerotinia nivalis TaxID=352851 RepID=A0A9X0DH28_9HELO|nr:hypothetical protein OCU04_010834 [Sclerotinia nivalis]
MEGESTWACKTMCAREGQGMENLSLLVNSEDTPSLLTSEWEDAVIDYSERHLTYGTDRLPALSGFARRFQDRSQWEYMAGLWLSGFPACLAWYRRSSGVGPSLNNSVPSWSWASVSHGVFWPPENSYQPILKSCQLADIRCRPSTENRFGEVEKGSYTELTGMVIDAEMECDNHGCGSVTCRGFRSCPLIPDCLLISETTKINNVSEGEDPKSILDAERKAGIEGGQQARIHRAKPQDQTRIEDPQFRMSRIKGPVICLLLYTKECNSQQIVPRILILGAKSAQHGENDVYERLGFAGPTLSLNKNSHGWEDWESLNWDWNEWEGWFEGAEERTLRIE